MARIEDLLSEALKHATLGGKMPTNKMIAGLIRSIQINALTQARDQLDKMIADLAKKGVGVGVGDDSMNPFTILGVSMDCTEEELKKAYRAKAAKHHPDAGGTDKEMMMVNAAYEAIQRVKGWFKE